MQRRSVLPTTVWGWTLFVGAILLIVNGLILLTSNLSQSQPGFARDIILVSILYQICGAVIANLVVSAKQSKNVRRWLVAAAVVALVMGLFGILAGAVTIATLAAPLVVIVGVLLMYRDVMGENGD